MYLLLVNITLLRHLVFQVDIWIITYKEERLTWHISWLVCHRDVFTWKRHVYMIQMYWHERDIFARKRRICTKETYLHDTDVFTRKRCVCTPKRRIHTKQTNYSKKTFWHERNAQRDVFTLKKDGFALKRDLFTYIRDIFELEKWRIAEKRHKCLIHRQLQPWLRMTTTILQKRPMNTQKRPAWIRRFWRIQIEKRRIAFTSNCSHDSVWQRLFCKRDL